MLNSFCIKTNNKQVLGYLQSEFENCGIDNFFISVNQFKNYKNIILHYKGENKAAFYALIAKTLSLVINIYYEEHIIKKILLSNYFYFSEGERKQILDYCLEMLKESQEDKEQRDSLIYNELFKYVEKNKHLVIDGFVNFRLKKYIKSLDEFVDLAVDKFVVEREYNEFIDLLRTYVDSKENASSIVHLIYHDEESILLDEKKHLIDTSSEIFDGKYLSDITFSSNDYALNALLNLIPETIYIHLDYGENDEFINTIKQIFESRVKLCYNCPICNLYKKQKIKRLTIKE